MTFNTKIHPHNWTYQIARFLLHAIICTYSIYKEAPEDGPLRSETCRADTWTLINNQCCYIVYLVGMYIYYIYFVSVNSVPISVAAWSKARICGSSPAGIASSSPSRWHGCVSCECCVLSGRGLCIELITRPEECYRVWCVWVWFRNLNSEEALAH